MYHVPVNFLAEGVLSHIRRHELLKAGDRVGVAVSGGIDSVALLRLLLELRSELGLVLSVVHFNHKLRGVDSDADETFVEGLAHVHHLEFHSDSDDVAQHAREEHISLETAARELRYGFFRFLISDARELKPNSRANASAPKGPLFHEARALSRLDKIVTGHTLDDQAETVLMRLIRGAGMRGLGGIHPRLTVEDNTGEVCGEIVRPLLAFRRRELERYLKEIDEAWREDSSNSDHSFTRNRLRSVVLPVLENEFNHMVAENLADLADIARSEEDYWENEISGWMGTVVHWSEPDWARNAGTEFVNIAPLGSVKEEKDDLRSRIENTLWLVMNASVSRAWFLGETEAVQRRLIKAIGEHAGIPFEFKHVEEIRRIAEHDSEGKEISLPLGWKFLRDADELIFVTPDLRRQAEPQDYEYELSMPGRVIVHELGAQIDVTCIPAEASSRYNPDHLLDAALVCGPLRVRNWRAGDRFWPAHTKSSRKIKELLQERHIAGIERKLWPVVLMRHEQGDEIIWVRGFPPPVKCVAKTGRAAVLITETRLSGTGE